MSSKSNNSKQIPLFSPTWGKEEEAAVLKALSEGYLNEGKYVREFERMFAKFVGANYCVLVPNGALALYLAMQYEAGRQGVWRSCVIPDYYGIFAANAAEMLRMEVKPVDVSFTGSWSKMHDDYSVCVHANGRLATGVRGVEDCAQAITHHTKRTLSCYSFHPSKLMTCGGIGGAVCCDSERAYVALMAAKDHGRPERAFGQKVSEVHSHWGTNFKMADINAAFGVEQLKKLPKRLERLERNYMLYREILGERVEWLDGGAPSWRVDCLVRDPEATVEHLAKEGIEAKRFYTPLHMQPLYAGPDQLFPNTQYLYEHGLYLPGMMEDEEDIKRVCKTLLFTEKAL